MTEEQKQKEMSERAAKEVENMFAPRGTHTRGSHHYPSPSGPFHAVQQSAPTTRLRFDDDHSIAVRESPNEIIAKNPKTR